MLLRRRGLAPVAVILLVLSIVTVLSTTFVAILRDFRPPPPTIVPVISLENGNLTLINPTNDVVDLNKLEIAFVKGNESRRVSVRDEDGNGLWEPHEKAFVNLTPILREKEPVTIFVYYDEALVSSYTLYPSSLLSQDSDFPRIDLKPNGKDDWTVTVSDNSLVEKVTIEPHNANVEVDGKTYTATHETTVEKKRYSFRMKVSNVNPGIYYVVVRASDVTGKVSQRIVYGSALPPLRPTATATTTPIKDVTPTVVVVQPPEIQDGSNKKPTKRPTVKPTAPTTKKPTTPTRPPTPTTPKPTPKPTVTPTLTPPSTPTIRKPTKRPTVKPITPIIPRMPSVNIVPIKDVTPTVVVVQPPEIQDGSNKKPTKRPTVKPTAPTVPRMPSVNIVKVSVPEISWSYEYSNGGVPTVGK